MMNKKVVREHGKRLQKTAMEMFRKDVKFWLRGEVKERYEMLRITASDVAALLEIGQLLIEGNTKKASHMAYGLDTAVRDEIPLSVYNFLSKVL